MASWLDSFQSQASPELLEQAREAEKKSGGADVLLVKQKAASVDQVLAAKSEFFKLPQIRLPGYYPQDAALSLLNEEQSRRFKVLPLFVLGDRLYGATVDPDDLRAQDMVSKLTSSRFHPVLAYSSELEQAITRVYLSGQRAEEAMSRITEDRETESAEPLPIESVIEDGNSPAVKLVERILTQAIHLGASDIHIEPEEEKTALRYRIDGVLHDYPAHPAQLHPAVVSRIKIASQLDIAEKRLPQDGRTQLKVSGKSYDMRVSIIPASEGEAVVIRILNAGNVNLDLSAMGFDTRMLPMYERAISKPHGMVLVTGPTGSGKSTTLYATLKRIFTRQKKIITLEDPVENRIAGVTQIAIRSEIGYTFATGLRAILRHDPDIVMLGEIRDQESAQVAFKAALTGHLLFSTLHTNSAPEAVTRLVDMGLQPYQVSAALNGVLAQRLMRKLCSACRAPVKLSADHLAALGLKELPPGSQPHGAKGCSECQNIGYKGRVAIFEFLEMTPEMKALPPAQFTAQNLKKVAQSKGFTSLRHGAVGRFLQGMTSYSEVLAVTTG